MKTIEVFHEQGEAQQLKLFPPQVEPPPDDPQAARVLLHKVRLERTRQFGSRWLGLQLWKRLELDRFFEDARGGRRAGVPWSRVAAVLAIDRLCAPGSELAIGDRRYPATAPGDLPGIEEGKSNGTRLYRCLDRILPHKTKLERHLKQRYGALFGAACDVLLYDPTSTYGEGAAEKEPDDAPRLFARSSPGLRTNGHRAHRQQRGLPVRLGDVRRQPCRRAGHGSDPAHGGAQVRQGAADPGIRSGHCGRGEPSGDPQTRRPVPGGHAAPPDEAV
ncbi:MAG: hypothetical protein ACRD4O_19885 [Bryobacteraceae bacterium]